MHLLIHLLIAFILFFISHEHEATAQPYSSVVLPVTKHTDAAKPLYSVDLMSTYVEPEPLHSNFLIDINAPFMWHECIPQWNIYPGSCPSNKLCNPPVTCDDYQCKEVRNTYSYKKPSCPPESNNSTLPGREDCTCPVHVVDPVTGSCGEVLFNSDVFMVNISNGRNVLTGVYTVYTKAACAPSSSFKSFPANVTGVMAFSSSPYALSSYIFWPLEKKIALCFPSTSSAPGVLFVGGGPYYLLPNSDVDLRSLLSYTPLLQYPDSFGYFIGVKAIVIRKQSINIPGNSITKLSTIDPYTTLRTNIYNPVIQAFSFATMAIPRAPPVAPFGLCFWSFPISHWLRVPDIDFVLEDGKKWTISKANSIKQVTKEVACLAFVDGGATTEHDIVIGTFQFEDNFLVFDLENSSFGFSSSLLPEQTSCAKFNFTHSEY